MKKNIGYKNDKSQDDQTKDFFTIISAKENGGLENNIPSGTYLQRSRFAHLFKKDDMVCVFHSLTRRMLFGGQLLADLYETLSSPDTYERITEKLIREYSNVQVSNALVALKERSLLVQTQEEDADTYLRYFHGGLALDNVHHMYLLPTSDCNFRCMYCFLEDDERPLESCHMDLKTAELAIRMFGKLVSGNRPASVTIYGGEPLLNANTTFLVLRLLRQLQKEGEFAQGLDISMLSNGSLIDNEAIRVLQETRTGIGISIDGPRHLHDAARKDALGSGTFDSALRGFRLLQDAGLNPSVSCTLNAFTIHYIDEIVDFIINDLHPRGMGFNLLLPRVGNTTPCTALDYEFATREIIRAFERLRHAGIYEDRIMRRVRPYVENRFYYRDCMGVGGQIVVGPSGQIGPCQALLGMNDKKYFPLHILDLAGRGEALSSNTIYSNSLFDEWRHRFPLNMNECIDCFAVSICGGGCPYASEIIKGSIWEIDERVCYQAKNILEWMVWDTYRNMTEEEQTVNQGESDDGWPCSHGKVHTNVEVVSK